METYSMAFTSHSKRSSSKLYQDLWSARLHCINGSGLRSSFHIKMNNSTAQHRRSPTSKPHVGIVGAGLAGLRCADVLLRRGFQVTIMEGRDRVGGRCHQEQLPNGHWVDLGPNWIHGTEGNPFIDIAKQTDTAVGDFETGAFTFDENGKLLPTETAQKYFGIMWEIIGEAFAYANASGASIDKSQSLVDYFQMSLDDKIPKTEPDWEEKRRLLMQMSQLWGAFIGSPITQQSLKFFWLEECIEGENLFCFSTYKRMLDSIAKPALAGAKVLYNSIAETIKYRTEPGDRVSVQLKGGQALTFDEVVVTSPLGWLKRNLEAFEPRLPPAIDKAIGSIGYGSLEKVYISFPSAFWLSKKDEGSYAEGFIQWLQPLYGEEVNPNRWYQDAVELGSLPGKHAHPTLLFYTYGEQSAFITGRLAEPDGDASKAEFVFHYFKPYYSRLPGYVEGSLNSTPTAWKATAWSQDELAGHGSYGNFQVGLERGDEDIKAMRRGLPDQGLWLAGEHTAPYVALGTATGAYWSGELVAEKIGELYGLNDADTV